MFLHVLTYAYTEHVGKNRSKGKGEHTTDETFCTFSVFRWNGSLFELMIQCHLVLSDTSKLKDSGVILRQRSSDLPCILS